MPRLILTKGAFFNLKTSNTVFCYSDCVFSNSKKKNSAIFELKFIQNKIFFLSYQINVSRKIFGPIRDNEKWCIRYNSELYIYIQAQI